MEAISLIDTNELCSKIVDALKGQFPSLFSCAPSDELSDLLSLGEVSKLTGFSKYTIYGMTSRKEIPFEKKRRRLFFSRRAIAAWIKESKNITL